MRRSLAGSLEYIFGAVADRLSVPADRASEAFDAIRSHRVLPGVFGRYYKLVLAVQGGDDQQASDVFTQLIDLARQVPVFRADLYSDHDLGSEKQVYGDLIDPDPGLTPWLCPPAPAYDFAQRVRESLELIAVADRALADELGGLVVQVVGADPFRGAGARPFGSVSSFMLWGLLALNLARYRTAADLVQPLVHEAAHLLLFAHSIEGPLLTNPIEERYLSPLRPDPRPMDGVFHAVFVTARLHYLHRKLRQAVSETFQPIPLQDLDERLTDMRRLYFAGLETVREHAKLTAAGRQILEETLDYMQST